MIDGWVEKIYGSRVELETSSDASFQIGERFKFELHGKKMAAHFDAVLTDCHASISGMGRSRTGTNGTSAISVDANFLTLVFAIEGSFRYVNSVQTFRTRTEGIAVTLSNESGSHGGEVVDVGPFGFAFRSAAAFLPGAIIGFEIDSKIGLIKGAAFVKNCRKINDTMFRTGVHVEKLGRLDAPRWQRFTVEQ